MQRITSQSFQQTEQKEKGYFINSHFALKENNEEVKCKIGKKRRFKCTKVHVLIPLLLILLSAIKVLRYEAYSVEKTIPDSNFKVGHPDVFSTISYNHADSSDLKGEITAKVITPETPKSNQKEEKDPQKNFEVKEMDILRQRDSEHEKKRAPEEEKREHLNEVKGLEKPKLRLFTDFKVDQKIPYQNKFDGIHKCIQDMRLAISPKFKKPYVFDFNVEITTSQKILFMGDSVAIQFSQSLQEAVGADNQNRKVLRYSWGNHEGINLANPVRGGGAVAGWRITGMFQEKQMNNNDAMPNKRGGGWMSGDVENLKRALFMSSSTNSSSTEDSSLLSSCEIQEALTTVESVAVVHNGKERECPEENFDTIVHQFPFGWLNKPTSEEITFETIHEAVQLAGKTFGAKAAIITTIPMNNNVIDMINELGVINSAIYNYSNSFGIGQYAGHKSEEDNDIHVQKVVVMDLAQFSYELFAHNAAALEMIDNDVQKIDHLLSNNVTGIAEILNPLLSKRTICCHKEYGQIVGFACCRIRNKNRIKKCLNTKYTLDGMHWCMDEVGGRINGAFACLLKCIEENNGLPELRQCEKQCNDKFMSLKPIDLYGEN